MKGLISASLANPHAIIVMSLAVVVLGSLTAPKVPRDILPVFRSPAVQVLTFYGGMPAQAIEKDISNRMERITGQANGMKWQESRSILGASIVRNYFQDDVDPNGALTQVSSLSTAVIPNLPPGTLPPVVLPFDPTSTVPVALITLQSSKPDTEAILYDAARYQVRNWIMQNKGTNAPVVIGGKQRAVMLYLNKKQMDARHVSPDQVMRAVEKYNIFFPSGDVQIGDIDFALSSNSMFNYVERMGEIPLRFEGGSKFGFLNELATPEDASFIQTNIVRVDGQKQVYIPIYRQIGASTLAVVQSLHDNKEKWQNKVNQIYPDTDITVNVVMDQSVYVTSAITALAIEGLIGALLCSLVILLFLGQWRMTVIAILTLPLSVLASIVCLYYCGQTINVMTLAGLTLAIGPMIDSAIICLENTHRHLTMGATPKEAALNGASEVAMPELVSTLCTFLVLSPLALVPGMGKFLFLPMTLAVMFTMTSAYLLSRTFVPCASAYLLQHQHPDAPHGLIARAFAAWEKMIDRGIALYVRALDVVLRHKGVTIIGSFALLAVVLTSAFFKMQYDFFPVSDSGAFEIAVRAASGTKLENTEKMIVEVEKCLRENIDEKPKDPKEFSIISELGLTADWSSAYTVNSGPMDTIMKIQLPGPHERKLSAQEYVTKLRPILTTRFPKLEFSFDSGGLIRGALNEGKASPINIQLRGKQEQLFPIADKIKKKLADSVKNIVDVRVLQKPDYPELNIEVDRTKAASLGLNQEDIMKSVIAATNSSISYNKKIFWIDPFTGMQYFVGVQYYQKNLKTFNDLEEISITSPKQNTPIPLGQLLERRLADSKSQVPTEVHHVDLQTAIDLTMNVEGRDLGHVSHDVVEILNKYAGEPKNDPDGSHYWVPYDNPDASAKKTLKGSRLILTGEYVRMMDTFYHLGTGLILASLLIYFLMVALDKSFIVPLTVMLIVPLCLIGLLPMLFFTNTAINVQSLLGFFFVVGIKVANTVLMTDYAQELRRHEGLTPIQAIRKAASLRVRPVTMTALAAFFAMIPTALSFERGSEANAPLARAILGGLLAGEPATLFVLPALYAIMVRDPKDKLVEEIPSHLPPPEPLHG